MEKKHLGNKIAEGNNKERLKSDLWKKYSLKKIFEEGFVSLSEFRYHSFEESDFKKKSDANILIVSFNFGILRF